MFGGVSAHLAGFAWINVFAELQHHLKEEGEDEVPDSAPERLTFRGNVLEH